jgi:hypothetical protein
MPCENGPSWEDQEREQYEADCAAKAICEMAKLLTANQKRGLSAEARHAIEMHEKADNEREKRERADRGEQAARARAIEKLSPSERRLLGLR